MATTPDGNSPNAAVPEKKRGAVVAFLDTIEWLGNKLPDPAVLFVVGILTVWGMSWICSSIAFTETLPGKTEPLRIVNMLSLDKLADFLSKMTEQFVGFHPLGVVLVAMLGVGVADHSGFINAVLKSILKVTPRFLLTPMVIFVAVISHTAADAGYVVVIPLAGVIFYAAGRHPLAGIAAAFAGVSGGFSANFIPSGIDPLLAGLAPPTGASLVLSAEAAQKLSARKGQALTIPLSRELEGRTERTTIAVQVADVLPLAASDSTSALAPVDLLAAAIGGEPSTFEAIARKKAVLLTTAKAEV